jgi:hypothetical protein
MDSDDSPPAEIADYWAIQPRRTDMIMKWLNEPYLKEALEGEYVSWEKRVCMCKVAIGSFSSCCCTICSWTVAEYPGDCSLLCGRHIRWW